MTVKIMLVGGFDSQIIAYKMIQEGVDVRAVHFNSYSNSIAESAHSLVPMDTVDLKLPQGEGSIPSLDGRDMLMCTYVCMAYGATEIYLGILPEDINGYYPDMSLHYIEKLSEMLSYTFGRDIVVRYPACDWSMSKYDLYKYGVRNGLQVHDLISCFNVRQDDTGCGKCSKCLLRWSMAYRQHEIQPTEMDVDFLRDALGRWDHIDISGPIRSYLKSIE